MSESKVIGDTGFWYALLNSADDYHSVAHGALQELGLPLITTWPVITETCYLLQSRLGQAVQIKFLQATVQKELVELFEITADHVERMTQLMHQYTDLPMDLADASLVVLAEQLGSGLILSTDQRDFNAYRWKNRHPFKNLLLP